MEFVFSVSVNIRQLQCPLAFLAATKNNSILQVYYSSIMWLNSLDNKTFAEMFCCCWSFKLLEQRLSSSLEGIGEAVGACQCPWTLLESRTNEEETEWMLCLVCVCVRKNASVCVHVCLRLIDAAAALRLIGSHGDCIKRLLRLTFDPENTLLSIGRALSLSPPSHLLTRPHILTFFFLSRPCGRKGKLSFSSPSICPFILLSRSLSNREETRPWA